MINIDAILVDVKAHAAIEAPREACGLAVVIKGRLRYIPCRNIAGETEFAIHPEDQAKAEDMGEIVAICHSHPYLPPEPSEADRVMCEYTKLPWLIVNYPIGTHHILMPSGYRAPIIGRSFVHGVLDCYTLCRDYYYEVCGIELPDYQREDNWWLKGDNLYLDNFESAGFIAVQDGPHAHDAVLMQIASPVPNHAGVIDTNGYLVHHCYGRLSSRDVYGGYWRHVTTHVLRHYSLLRENTSC